MWAIAHASHTYQPRVPATIRRLPTLTISIRAALRVDNAGGAAPLLLDTAAHHPPFRSSGRTPRHVSWSARGCLPCCHRMRTHMHVHAAAPHRMRAHMHVHAAAPHRMHIWVHMHMDAPFAAYAPPCVHPHAYAPICCAPPVPHLMAHACDLSSPTPYLYPSAK